MWDVIARWGQVEWVAPAITGMAVAYLLRGRETLGSGLLVGFLMAALITACTKVAFMGWGLGSALLDFTGISGHAMCAAAIYPLLGASLKCDDVLDERATIAAGLAVALVIAFSRIQTQAHSASEIVAGLALGGAVAWTAVRRGGPPPRLLPPGVVLVTMGLVAAWPSTAGSVPGAHSVLTRAALALSGRAVVYTRADLHRPRGVVGLYERGE
jgi:hypothetical protein